MKRVVGVSIGSSARDHHVDIELLGQPVRIERRGTDGDLKKAYQLISELDGQVDCIGIGGMDVYIYAGGRRYAFRDGMRLAGAARRTPVVDGSGLKDSLERWVIEYLRDQVGIHLANQRVLMVAAVDRFGMAEEFARSGCRMLFGDLLFALGVPIPLTSLKTLDWTARLVAPIVTKLPFTMLYPTGEKQTMRTPKFTKYFDQADIIAGDFHFIRRYMPDDLKGKGVVTNTVTEADVKMLAQANASYLVTTTPDLCGRSFGTNVVEAALVALAGRSPQELTAKDYLDLIGQVGFRPRVITF